MKKHVFLIAIVVALLSDTASAFVELQGLEPNPAQAGQGVDLLLRDGLCDAVLEVASVTRVGQEIDILIDGVRETTPCAFPIVNGAVPIGDFPPGEYTVTVRYRFTPLFQPEQIETLGVISLMVEAPRAVPTGHPIGFALLALLISGLGAAFITNKGKQARAR